MIAMFSIQHSAFGNSFLIVHSSRPLPQSYSYVFMPYLIKAGLAISILKNFSKKYKTHNEE